MQVRFRPHVPADSAVSTFKAKVAPPAYTEALELLKYQLLELVCVDLLDDAFIMDHAHATDGIFGRLHVPGGLHVEVGFDLFLQFVVWRGTRRAVRSIRSLGGTFSGRFLPATSPAEPVPQYDPR